MREGINPDRFFRTMSSLDTYVNICLGLKSRSKTLSGFDYNPHLIYAAVANTYVETLGNKADSLHLAIKKRDISDIYLEYLETVRLLGKRVGLDEKDVVLAFDYTDEEYYGKLSGLWMHTWTGEKAVTGKFKFLTCAIVCTTAPLRVPILSMPVPMGHNKGDVVLRFMELVKPLVRSVELILFDRGFYDKDLIIKLTDGELPYLIFVPKNDRVKRELDEIRDGEKKTIRYEFKLNKDKTTKNGHTTMAFLKQIYDGRTNKNYDWAFATNMGAIDLNEIIRTYKKRWRIETMFRVQDEARIRTKSRDIKIRYFYFAYSQVLQLIWSMIYKDDMGFKEFQIILNEVAKERWENTVKKNRRGPV